MKKIKEIYENRISTWAKYSGYRIIQRHGEDYIAPEENAALMWYDPVEKEETLIADVLNMGKSIADAKNGEEMTAAALDFVSKYGLLGWMPSLPVNPYFYLESKVLLPENEYFLFSSTTKDTEKYLEQFQVEPNGEELLGAGQEKGRSPIYDLVFSKNYCEPVNWIIPFLQEMFEHFRTKEMLEDPNYEPWEKMILRKRIESFYHPGVPYVLRYDPVPSACWVFDSLKMVVETACVMALGQEENPVASCKHCGKYFYREDVRSAYCSHRCRNQYHVYRSRKRKRLEEND